MPVSGQSVVVMAVAGSLIGLLYLFFDRTLYGKALRATAVNRKGAQLVGIGTSQAGRMAFGLAAGLGTLAGTLIAPLNTVGYDTGFVVALKGFVAAIVGGLASYPLAAAGALLVGLLELFLLLGQCIQGGDRVHADHPGAGLAFADFRPWRRRMKMSTKKLQWLMFGWFFVFPFLPVPGYWITIGNYIGLYSIVALGLVLLTGIGGLTSFGQAAFVGLGAYTTATHHHPGLVAWLGLGAGLVVSAWRR
jgi:branched-subunit amino acid ABC-type transport system permease component